MEASHKKLNIYIGLYRILSDCLNVHIKQTEDTGYEQTLIIMTKSDLLQVLITKPNQQATVHPASGTNTNNTHKGFLIWSTDKFKLVTLFLNSG